MEILTDNSFIKEVNSESENNNLELTKNVKRKGKNYKLGV